MYTGSEQSYGFIGHEVESEQSDGSEYAPKRERFLSGHYPTPGRCNQTRERTFDNISPCSKLYILSRLCSAVLAETHARTLFSSIQQQQYESPKINREKESHMISPTSDPDSESFELRYPAGY